MTDKELIAKSVREARILIVDDDTQMTALLEHHLSATGYENITVTHDGKHAIELIGERKRNRKPTFDLVILDLCFPGEIGGEDVYEYISKYGDISIIIVSALSAQENVLEALKSRVVDEYLVKPVDFGILRLVVERTLSNRLFIAHLQASRNRNQKMFLNILQVMAKVLEAKDSNTRSHSENVAKYSRQIAKKIGYNEAEMEAIQIAGILHDFGKIGVDEALLRKPGSLTKEEYENIKQHPLIASIILEPLDELKLVIKDIRHHHERYDGSGYPDGLAGGDIPLGARILAIADSYDAMTSRRSYHEPLAAAIAVEELKRCAGSQFDPELVIVFEEVIMGTQKNKVFDNDYKRA